jgi:membrane protein DedA with SNARE-associated domain
MKELVHDLLTLWFNFTLDWGYLGIIFMMALESTAVPVPAEIVVPPAAFWAAQGKLTFWGVVLAATFGSWVGSAVSYAIGYKFGRPLLTKYGRYFFLNPDKLAKAEQWFDTYGTGGIFIARLLPGIRHLISIPAGIFRMPFGQFSLMTVLGAGIFCSALAWFGQKVIGDQPELMNDPTIMISVLKERSHYLVFFALAVGLLYWIMTWMQKRVRTRSVEEVAAPDVEP